MALCRFYHWSFDRGFMSVGKEYEVLISPLSRQEQNNPGPIMTLDHRPFSSLLMIDTSRIRSVWGSTGERFSGSEPITIGN
jgi:hypothetical protein